MSNDINDISGMEITQWTPMEIRVVLVKRSDFYLQQKWVDKISGKQEWRRVPWIDEDKLD